MTDDNADSDSSSDSEGSVSRILQDARMGRVIAIERLTETYLIRLEAFAKSRMRQSLKQVEDEQDVALRVLAEFFNGFLDGKYDGLKNRKQLWGLLAKITICRVFDHFEKYSAQKRGSETPLSASNRLDEIQVKMHTSLDAMDPQLSVSLKESYSSIIGKLDDPKDEKIFQLHLQGLENKQIAKKVWLGERSIRDRLDKIRRRLIDELTS